MISGNIITKYQIKKKQNLCVFKFSVWNNTKLNEIGKQTRIVIVHEWKTGEKSCLNQQIFCLCEFCTWGSMLFECSPKHETDQNTFLLSVPITFICLSLCVYSNINVNVKTLIQLTESFEYTKWKSLAIWLFISSTTDDDDLWNRETIYYHIIWIFYSFSLFTFFVFLCVPCMCTPCWIVMNT